MRDAYVYYRVAPAKATQATRCVDALLQALTAYCAQPPRRLVRCDDASTWMEIYVGIADWAKFVTEMQCTVQALQIDACIEGERHLECFVAPAATT